MYKEIQRGNYYTLFPYDYQQYEYSVCPACRRPGQPGCGRYAFTYALFVSKSAASHRGFLAAAKQVGNGRRDGGGGG